MADLIYISNTQIPSRKANTYQSFCMCEAFAGLFSSVEFWHPSRRGDYSAKSALSDPVNNTFLDYGVVQNFKLKRLLSIDLPWVRQISDRMWFQIEALSFSIICFLSLMKAPEDRYVFVRDSITLSALAFGKKVGLIKQKVFFEAHKFSVREARHAKHVNGIVVINNHLKMLYEGFSTNVLVAHDGVKKDELIFSEKQSNRRNKVVLYSGNLFPWKGIHTLADCIEYLPSNCKVVFLGGSPDTLPAFRKYVEGRKGIEILGYKPRSEVRSYLDAADVLVLPNSSKDPMSAYTSPLKLFEYMAARKPIVASRIPSLQEILRDGENAILFNPDDPEDLAKKIQWIFDNDCSAIVDQAWQDVHAYTWNKRAENIFSWMHDWRMLTATKFEQNADKETLA